MSTDHLRLAVALVAALCAGCAPVPDDASGAAAQRLYGTLAFEPCTLTSAQASAGRAMA